MSRLTYRLQCPKEPLWIVMWALFNVDRWICLNKQAVVLLKCSLLKKQNKILIYVYSDEFYSNLWEVVLINGLLYTLSRFRFWNVFLCWSEGTSIFRLLFLIQGVLWQISCSLTTTSLMSSVKFLKCFLLLNTFPVFNLPVWLFMELFC